MKTESTYFRHSSDYWLSPFDRTWPRGIYTSLQALHARSPTVRLPERFSSSYTVAELEGIGHSLVAFVHLAGVYVFHLCRAVEEANVSASGSVASEDTDREDALASSRRWIHLRCLHHFQPQSHGL